MKNMIRKKSNVQIDDFDISTISKRKEVAQ